jgi:flagellar hook-associated protein 3 FlgL
MVYRVSTSQLAQNGLNGILKNQATMDNIMSQISSGLRNDLDPVEKAQQLSYSVKISNNAQHIRNGETIMPQLTNQETTLSAISEQMIRLQEAMTQSQNPAVYNKEIAQVEVNEIKQNILSLANTRDSQGNYLFSGYKTQTKPFTDLESYQGDQGVNSIRVGDEALAVMNVPGDQVIGKNLQESFAKIQKFIDTGVADQTMFDSVQKSISDLSVTQTKIGTTINKITNFTDQNNEMNVLNKTRLSQIQDADIASLAVQLGAAKNASEAALKSYSTIQNLSLFNYM